MELMGTRRYRGRRLKRSAKGIKQDQSGRVIDLKAKGPKDTEKEEPEEEESEQYKYDPYRRRNNLPQDDSDTGLTLGKRAGSRRAPISRPRSTRKAPRGSTGGLKTASSGGNSPGASGTGTSSPGDGYVAGGGTPTGSSGTGTTPGTGGTSTPSVGGGGGSPDLKIEGEYITFENTDEYLIYDSLEVSITNNNNDQNSKN